MSFTRLKELAQLSPAPLTEDRSTDLDGINAVIGDALADLGDKVELLGDLARETGALELDTHRDAQGRTIFQALDEETRTYRASMEKLLVEAELLLRQALDDHGSAA